MCQRTPVGTNLDAANEGRRNAVATLQPWPTAPRAREPHHVTARQTRGCRHRPSVSRRSRGSSRVSRPPLPWPRRADLAVSADGRALSLNERDRRRHGPPGGGRLVPPTESATTEAPFAGLSAGNGVFTSNDEYSIWLHRHTDTYQIRYPDERRTFTQSADPIRVTHATSLPVEPTQRLVDSVVIYSEMPSDRRDAHSASPHLRRLGSDHLVDRHRCRLTEHDLDLDLCDGSQPLLPRPGVCTSSWAAVRRRWCASRGVGRADTPPCGGRLRR